LRISFYNLWLDNPSRSWLVTASLSKKVALVATLVAVGSVVRFGIGELAMITPTPFYGFVIKVGLSETLAFIMGIIYGPVVGFLGGSSIIVISDLPVQPGPWTPFIAGIIGGVFGIGGGSFRRLSKNKPNSLWFAASALILTAISEFLQNLWVSAFYSVPLLASMIAGIPSLIAALVNNITLFTILAPRVISTIQEQI
jgi:uncharacterized membrane protein